MLNRIASSQQQFLLSDGVRYIFSLIAVATVYSDVRVPIPQDVATYFVYRKTWWLQDEYTYRYITVTLD